MWYYSCYFSRPKCPYNNDSQIFSSFYHRIKRHVHIVMTQPACHQEIKQCDWPTLTSHVCWVNRTADRSRFQNSWSRPWDHRKIYLSLKAQTNPQQQTDRVLCRWHLRVRCESYQHQSDRMQSMLPYPWMVNKNKNTYHNLQKGNDTVFSFTKYISTGIRRSAKYGARPKNGLQFFGGLGHRITFSLLFSQLDHWEWLIVIS